MNDYQFTVTEAHDFSPVFVYDVNIRFEGTKAKGRIQEMDECYTIIDIQFCTPPGIYGLYRFTNWLFNGYNKILPVVVQKYNESLLAATA
jgi:hypothetical protein